VGDDRRRYKLFCFSTLRAPKGRRRVVGETLWLRPGGVEWLVGSPSASFLTHLATGLLSTGGVRVGETTLPIVQAQTTAVPDFPEGVARMTCLTPVVASVPSERGGKRYLRAEDGAAFSEAVHKNLLRKYAALHGQVLESTVPFALTWDADYLARSPHGGQKKICFKGIDVIGVQSPCTLSGDPALLELAYETGLGELNSAGFGMIDLGTKE
jgi:CRISPR-associated endoribonuclease Cas6